MFFLYISNEKYIKYAKSMSAKYTGSQGQSTIMCKNYKSPLKHELKKKKKRIKILTPQPNPKEF